MVKYEFVTVWHVQAPLEEVWNEIFHSEQWPEWWRGVEEVTQLEKGGENRVGGISRYTWKSKLPYKLTFDMKATRVEPMSVIAGRAFGELAGEGVWHFTVEEGYTILRYDWNVETTKKWMNWLAPVLRPLFQWNHDVIMRWGADGLSKRLGASVRDESLQARRSN